MLDNGANGEEIRNTPLVRDFFILGVLLLGSLLIGAALGEVVLRVAANPIDYLAPRLDLDEIQGYHLAPHSAGHDAWGFRNARVPQKADIVTIGDSQTYGDGAKYKGSWPAHLARLTGKTVYNLSLGGYGPTQYLYLLQNYALKLNPDQIILGFYCGNDFINTYEMVYGYDYWKDLRNPQFAAEKDLHGKAEEVIQANQPGRFSLLRSWLKSHSMLYRFLSIPLTNMTQSYQKRAGMNRRFTYVEDRANNIHTGFKPLMRYQQSDVNDLRIQEGMRLAFILLDRMNETCKARGIKFSLVLIPTKELVFARFIEHHKAVQNSDIIDEVIASDRILRQKMMDYCRDRGIPFADPLPAMEAAAGKQEIYHNDLNDHPNANGYGIIAESVKSELMTAR